MFTDSHCHLNFPELAQRLPDVLAAMQAAQVTRALCISTTMEEFPAVRALAAAHPHIWASVGVHPDSEGVQEPAVADLLAAIASFAEISDKHTEQLDNTLLFSSELLEKATANHPL